MGQHFQFTCANCGFSAEVSGGDDAGMVVATTTIVCGSCRRLYDVVTIDRKEWQNQKVRPLRCPKSAKHQVERWKDPGPCPKCNQPLINGGRVCLWD